MSFRWYDVVGSLGVLLVLLSYLLLQLGRLRATDFAYSAANGLGALLILVSLSFDFNLPAVLIEAAWLLISLFGLARWFLHTGVRG